MVGKKVNMPEVIFFYWMQAFKVKFNPNVKKVKKEPKEELWFVVGQTTSTQDQQVDLESRSVSQ